MESNLDRLEGRTEGFRLLFMRDGGVRHGSITIRLLFMRDGGVRHGSITIFETPD